MTWLPKISSGEPTYMVQRYLFSVATMTDVPTIPVTLSGLVLLISWRAKSCRRQNTEAEHELGSAPKMHSVP
ncbi:MAG: hypothetical protein CMJ64_07115 [Planctomycetaceae bacterium]|nr:hypothetical protein [Planctomycetaceae bacterium]